MSGKVCYEHKLPDDVLGTSVGYLLKSTLSVAELATTDLDQNDDDPLSLRASTICKKQQTQMY